VVKTQRLRGAPIDGLSPSLSLGAIGVPAAAISLGDRLFTYTSMKLLKSSSFWACCSAVSLFGQSAATDSNPIALDKFVVQSVRAPVANNVAGIEQISLQPAASSVINVIKFLPGVSLSQGDAIGGDDWSTRINIRGFTEGQLGFSVDGVTTGYTSYGGGAKPNRYVDIENLSSVVVSQGAAEISSASAQALGGTLAYASISPSSTPGVLAKLSGGSFGLQRSFVRGRHGQNGW
jgi:iron complex outermembrane receptor protein